MAATFVPFTTYCDSSFWNEINKRKLNEWMLDESPKEIYCTLSIHDKIGSNCRLSLSHECFQPTKGSIQGDLKLFNTLENFKAFDKAELLKTYSETIWEKIKSQCWLKKPEILLKFAVIAFADLKKFRYVYWTCVPALCYPSNIGQKIDEFSNNFKPVKDYYNSTKEIIFLSTPDGNCSNIDKIVDISDSKDIFVVVADPSPISSSFGWVARNFLAAIAFAKPQWINVRFLSLRGDSCKVFEYNWDKTETSDCPKSVGWERNANDKLSPYTIDLSGQFDANKLMDQSVDLNLSLIKWRLVPDIKLERYSKLKVLIFGAGTLGCNIARGLMGWGVRKITFIDNSTVSFSNPVRQSLSEFADARDRRGKAETAAAALKRIYPSIDSEAVNVTVPMPGHAIDASQEKELAERIEKLDLIVKEHDVLFLALDSREARWLPTVLANKYRKIAISVALGFDTYVIIRHGIGFSTGVDSKDASDKVPYEQLSCYFCSDVTAPGNSTSDRTLDQQCTVSRPGLSMIASGMAVELLSSVLQYPEPLEAPAYLNETDENLSLMGDIPHQIRGFVSRFQQITPCVKRFDKCVGCGAAVREQLELNGWKFVRNVMNSPSHLEAITGLDQLQYSVNDIEIDFDDSESLVSL